VDSLWPCVVPSIESNRAKVAEKPIASTRARHAMNFTLNRVASPLKSTVDPVNNLSHKNRFTAQLFGYFGKSGF
jgi:hypothetical protein